MRGRKVRNGRETRKEGKLRVLKEREDGVVMVEERHKAFNNRKKACMHMCVCKSM